VQPAESAPVTFRAPIKIVRHLALALSAAAVAFSLVCGWTARRSFRLASTGDDDYLLWLATCLTCLLVALLLRMGAAVCELIWLERTWGNVPEELRKVGPVEKVNSVMVIGVSLVPVVAWFWKLGLVKGIVDGFEHVRTQVPFKTPIPRRLGMAAVIIGWVPGLNVYIAPFLWEIFATRVDKACKEIVALREQQPAAASSNLAA
jgi:hypothetical protein